MRDASFPLHRANSRQPLRLTRITAGRKLTHRLTELGLTPGVHVEILHDHGNSLILAVRDSRLALGRSIAGKILVEVA